ncbi:hypothetical protein [Mariprofundus sp. KV]|uniref:hypothetical protein n=1 Tax=Mariprofundus sp. KV TaxID=2608715 RepID=UPI0015A34503|nr:hypothetical protein [Mariprofundus sp. KV]NWF36369.1 hypothetical protein [Mariprofundus sp. KV]
MKQRIRLATHSSPLALKYAQKVATNIKAINPHIQVEMVRVSTKSDTYYYESPSEIGGKCLYLNEVIQAVRDGHADIASHVIEETPHSKIDWPRGWLSVKCKEDEGETIHVFAGPKQIPERFWRSKT